MRIAAYASNKCAAAPNKRKEGTRNKEEDGTRKKEQGRRWKKKKEEGRIPARFVPLVMKEHPLACPNANNAKEEYQRGLFRL